ncbi:trypsin-like serine peptidase [Alkalinema pantanalense CENA528]|uniref:trypsin-like serine peptidase n=1 Tax=Alkalinema pantanalense TaxID=1620705 RepID=UPI003D6DF7CB
MNSTVVNHFSKTQPFKPQLRSTIATTIASLSGMIGIIPSSLPIAQADIIGADNRIVPSYEWMTQTNRQAIGRLEIQKANGLYYACTFTVVGRNIGLTNTHCLLDEQGRGPRQIKAFALQHGNRVFATANIDTYWTGLKTFPKTLGDATRDWAVIRFTSDLGTKTGWFGNAPYSNQVAKAGQSVAGKLTNLIGYSGGGTTPTGHLNCNILPTISGIVPHNCDSTAGSSGSSVHTSDLHIQGLNWGSFTYRGHTINGAVPLERFMPAVQKLRSTGAASNTIVPIP